MHLYDQLRQLQYLENAFYEWSSYREQLTNYLIAQTSSNDHIAIIGAGGCNDLNLEKLSSHVSTITLIDKDYKSMKEGMNRYKLKNNDPISLLQTDLIGITDVQYRYYADKLIDEVRKKGYQTDVHNLAHLANNLIDELTSTLSMHLDLGVNKYDTIIAIGIHSQLLSMLEWIWSIVLQTIKQEEATVRQKIIELNTLIVERINDIFIKATAHQLIIGCEEERIGRLGTIQGAVQCLKDMERRCYNDQVTLVHSCHLEWPFNLSQGIAYRMHIASYKKDTCLSSKKAYNK